MSFYPLNINKIVQETHEAKTIYFDIPTNLESNFQFLPGQYLTLKSIINNTEVRRAYSICTTPFSREIGVTVKKVKSGKMSTWLCDHIKEGESLDVMPPEGRFVLNTDHNNKRKLFFIAGGSGITPIMSMIETTLENEPLSQCFLLYANRNEDCIIFKDKIQDLQNKYNDQLFVEHILSRPNVVKKGGLMGFFAKKSTDWKGLIGRINENILASFLKDFEFTSENCHFYLCGPGNIIDVSTKFLLASGIPKNRINREVFTSGGNSGKDKPSIDNHKTPVEVTLKGQHINIEVSNAETILDALVAQKYDPPYSCTSGACSTCVAKVTSGEVTMDSCYALEDDEIEAGYILTCQARPKSESVVITYDV